MNDGGGRRGDNLFLPDFCSVNMVFAVVIIGELLVFVLALASAGEGRSLWRQVALISVFVQWIGLSSAALLCYCRRWLVRLSDVQAGIASYAIILGVTLVLSEAAYWLIHSGVIELGVLPAGYPPIDWVGAALPAPRPAPAPPHGEFLFRNLLISAIVGALALRHLYVQHQWKRNIELEARARVQALQSRIRPHFLFNSMNTIASLSRSRPAMAEQVTEDLADLFRVSLSDASVPIDLSREIEICRQYLRIEEQRLGGRFETLWAVDGLPGDAKVPGLTLQPLIENAVYHGIEPADTRGYIHISGAQEDGRVRIRICNSLPGHPAAAHRQGNRLAQENVEQRLKAVFGEGAGLRFEPGEREYCVELRFPYPARQA